MITISQVVRLALLELKQVRNGHRQGPSDFRGLRKDWEKEGRKEGRLYRFLSFFLFSFSF